MRTSPLIMVYALVTASIVFTKVFGICHRIFFLHKRDILINYYSLVKHIAHPAAFIPPQSSRGMFECVQDCSGSSFKSEGCCC